MRISTHPVRGFTGHYTNCVGGVGIEPTGKDAQPTNRPVAFLPTTPTDCERAE